MPPDSSLPMGAQRRRTAARPLTTGLARQGWSARILSPQLRMLASRRFAQLGGLVCASAGLVLLAALLSYDARDPSLDTASLRATANLIGPVGAMVADPLIQGFGAAATLPALVLLAWGWRLAAHRGLNHPLLRLAALATAMSLLAAAFVSLAAGHVPAWPSLAGPGGAAGAGIAAPLLRTAALFAPAAAGPLTALPCLLAAILAGWLAFGLSRAEWRAIAAGCAAAARTIRAACAWFVALCRRAGGLHRHISAPLAAQFDDTDGLELPPPFSSHPAAASLAEDAHRLVRAPAAAIPPGSTTQRSTTPRAAAPLPTAPSAAAEPPAPASLRARVIAARIRPTPAVEQASLDLQQPGWVFPSLSLLRAPPARASTGPSEDALDANARLLESVLSDYGVQGTIRDIRPGPVVTLYELEPAPGIRSARVIGLADDVARSLCVTAVRIATVPGRNVIGIEVPNAKRETVYLRELIGSEEWSRQGGRLGLALGKDISGAPQIADLARMPHLLIAGTTGSGKSVGINAMILSLLYKLSPDECRLILIDPKMLELSVYEGIPHLMAPVVTEPAKAVTALKWTVREMERRYRAMTGLNVRNMAGYNDRVAEARARGEVVTRRVQTGFDPETNRPTFEEQPLQLETMPLIVVVIDEMADLMMVAGKEIEAAVQRLAQMARAAGIHVIMATQRPSVDVITGTIKANFPTRISFQVISKFDSRTILGEQGSEQLLGMGDMLYMAGGGRITRVHGPFVTDREVEDVVAFLRTQGEPDYLDEVTEGDDDTSAGASQALLPNPAYDNDLTLFDQAVAIVAREGKASTSFMQRHLGIGYNKAAKLIEQMEKEGIITPPNHVGRRDVLVRRTMDED